MAIPSRRVTAYAALAAMAGLAAIAATVPASATVSHRTTAVSRPRPARLAMPARLPQGAVARGALAPSTVLHLGFALTSRDPAGLATLATAVNTPGSPSYRHYLARGEFAKRFGASPAAAAAVRGFLTARGLHPGAVVDGLTITVAAPASAIAAALHTSFASYRLRDGRNVFNNSVAPSLPTGVSADLQAVIGLNNITLARPALASATPSADAPTPVSSASRPVHAATTVAAPCAAATTTAASFGAWTADKMASAYKLSGLYADGLDATGETVGILEMEPYSTDDINAYQTCYGTDSTVTNEVLNPSSSVGTGSGTGESALDIETVISAAPGAAIKVYTIDNGYQYYAYQAMASEDVAKVLSTSWGSCEPDMSSNFAYAQAESTVFEQMAVQGQDLFAAAGDTGSEGCERGSGSTGLAVLDPASQTDVTGVGGTRLTDLTPTESVWNNPSPGGAGGGGLSTFWSMPSYQTGSGVTNSYTSAAPCSAVTGTTADCREVPDVSADADPNTAYVVYVQGIWTAIGGTSAAAPEWAGLMSVVNQACAVGFANPAFYQLADGANTPFNDITSGNNDYGDLHVGAYPATTAYDQASGLGTPSATRLVADLCAPAAPTNVRATPGSGQATVTFTAPTGVTGITGYTVTATDTTTSSNGGLTVTGASSPIVVSGLTNGDDYTFSVRANTPWASGASATAAATPASSVLGSDEQLTMGQSVSSANGAYTLRMQSDGNLVLYAADGSATFATATNPGGVRAVMQSDGNFVVYSADGSALWSSKTPASEGAYLSVGDDGRITVSASDGSVLWEPGVLPAGARLSAGQDLTSPGGAYTLAMQPDGNLVEYTAAGIPVWASGTDPDGSYAVMQSDGNFVVYNNAAAPLWSSATFGVSTAFLSLSDGGQLLVRTTSSVAWGLGVLAANERLSPGQTMQSADGVYRLSMQSDGNLVEYASGGTPVWASDTDTAGSSAVMQDDGNFVVYSPDDVALWATDTSGRPGAYLSLSGSGQLAVQAASGAPLWGTGLLASGQRMVAGDSVTSPNGDYTLSMQPDGDLIEFDSSGVSVWTSGTSPDGDRADMQTDGNFVVYSSDSTALWSSGTPGRTGAYLRVGDDGSIAIVSLAGATLATITPPQPST